MQRFISLNGDKVIYYDEDDKRALKDYPYSIYWNDNNLNTLPLDVIYDNEMIKDIYQFYNIQDDLNRFIERNNLQY